MHSGENKMHSGEGDSGGSQPFVRSPESRPSDLQVAANKRSKY